MASDEEAYKVFNELTDPVIADLHPKFDLKYTYRFEDLNLVGIESKITSMSTELKQMESI